MFPQKVDKYRLRAEYHLRRRVASVAIRRADRPRIKTVLTKIIFCQRFPYRRGEFRTE